MNKENVLSYDAALSDYLVDYDHFVSSDGESHISLRHICHPDRDVEQKQLHLVYVHSALSHQDFDFAFYRSLLTAFSPQLVLTTFDLVGHGLSGGEQAYVHDFSYYQADLLSVLKSSDTFHQESENVSYFLAGSDLGGLIISALLILQERQIPIAIKGTVLINPLIDPISAIPRPVLKQFSFLGEKLAKLRFSVCHDFLELNSNYEMANRIGLDPLHYQFITLGMANQIFHTSKRIRSLAYYINTPCLFLFSKDDTVTENETGKLFAKAIDSKLVSMREYPAKHDLLNEDCREQVFQDIIGWLKKLF